MLHDHQAVALKRISLAGIIVSIVLLLVGYILQDQVKWCIWPLLSAGSAYRSDGVQLELHIELMECFVPANRAEVSVRSVVGTSSLRVRCYRLDRTMQSLRLTDL